MRRNTVDTDWLTVYYEMVNREWTHAEIASKIGISVDCLGKRLQRARARQDRRAIYPKNANRRRLM